MNTAIWWVRRDLRIDANHALATAVANAGRVIPLIPDERLLSGRFASEMRCWFLCERLRDLDRQLRAVGSRLIIRRGDPVDELRSVIAESGAAFVIAEEDFSANF